MKTIPSKRKGFLERLQTLKPKPKPKVHVFSRHCCESKISQHKNRPGRFSREKCYQNLLATSDNRIQITFLIDTFYGGLQDHFLVNEKKHPVIDFKVGSEAGSFLKTLEYIRSRRLSPRSIIYFVEDDYIHRPGWVDILLEAFEMPWVDYVTLYDHRDKYFLPMYEKLNVQIFHTSSTHWRTTPSMTNTFAMRHRTLKKHFDVHKAYSEGRTTSSDHDKFCKLREMGATLISPIPGWSTHEEVEYESPCIDWEKVLSQTSKNLL